MILLMKLSKVNVKCSRSNHIEARFCRLLRGYASEVLLTLGLDAAAFDRAAAKPTGPEAAVGKEQVGSLYTRQLGLPQLASSTTLRSAPTLCAAH